MAENTTTTSPWLPPSNQTPSPRKRADLAARRRWKNRRRRARRQAAR